MEDWKVILLSVAGMLCLLALFINSNLYLQTKVFRAQQSVFESQLNSLKSIAMTVVSTETLLKLKVSNWNNSIAERKRLKKKKLASKWRRATAKMKP